MDRTRDDWGHPVYDFVAVEIDGRRALLMRSNGDHSTTAKKIQVDLKTTPWLEWDWKVVGRGRVTSAAGGR